MSDYDYDLLVIGAGSGGVRASRVAARLGAKVAVVEERYLGGTCVNVGCVPKKLFVYASLYRDLFKAAASFGWQLEDPKFTWSQLLANKDKEIDRLNQVYRRLLDVTGVTLFEERAKILGPHKVAVGNRELTAERILIAVGGWPWKPDIPGADLAITSNEAFFLDKLPESIVIVGGGYIAVEFAGIFDSLGVNTHLCYRGELFLRGFDSDLRACLAKEMANKGVHLHFNTDIKAIEACAAGGFKVVGEKGEEWRAEQVMYATGRRPKTDDLGLENTAVRLHDDGAPIIDEYFQTHEPSIYALGDATGPLELTPVALAQGQTLAQNLYGGDDRKLSYRNVPAAVFSQPSIGTVGLTEEQAREQYTHIDIYKNSFRPMQYSLGEVDERVLVKLVVDRETDRVLGCHMLGPDAAEIIQGMAVALTAGATKKDFDRTIGIHPTMAEEFVSLRQANG